MKCICLDYIQFSRNLKDEEQSISGQSFEHSGGHCILEDNDRGHGDDRATPPFDPSAYTHHCFMTDL